MDCRRAPAVVTKVVLAVSALALAACGGGDGDRLASDSATIDTSTVDISTTVDAVAGPDVPAVDDVRLPPPVYPEPQRPQFHFSPASGWLNDPNGLYWANGEYHLFYQHFPNLPFWGPMHWGHAVSRDLIHWEHLPVALEPDDVLGWAFSGCAVWDEDDARGLCGGGGPCPLLFLTHHGGEDRAEKQSLAIGDESGRTFRLHDGNPIVPNPGIVDFRDPKVVFHAPSETWVMVLSGGDEIQLYRSPDLLDWSYASAVTVAPPEGAFWEMPDLFALPLDDDPGELRWVLKMDVGRGPSDWSSSHYLVGSFDGVTFVPDDAAPRVVDAGPDFYAAQSWDSAPDGRRVWIGWMNNWAYALATPTDTWRGAMTVARDVALVTGPDGPILVQRPVPELETLRVGRLAVQRDVPLAPGLLDGVEGDQLDVELSLDVSPTTELRLAVRTGDGEETVVGWDGVTRVLFVDRAASGDVAFHREFAGRWETPLVPRDGRLDLRVLVDWSSLEVFADGGRVTMTTRIFPAPTSRGLRLDGSDADVRSLDVWALETAW